MKWFNDYQQRQIRLTDERENHFGMTHPEMANQLDKIEEVLAYPDTVVQSNSDKTVELFYRHYAKTPVTEKYMCVTVKVLAADLFIITAYFTDKIKKGALLWQKK